MRRGIFEKATKPAFSKEVYKVQGYHGNRHRLVDGKGNLVDNVPVASDIRKVHSDSELHIPKERTFTPSSINKPYTKTIRRSKRGVEKVDYSKFL